MKPINFEQNEAKNNFIKKYCFSSTICQRVLTIYLLINSFIAFYLLNENKKLKSLLNYKNIEDKINDKEQIINKDMIGLEYPEIKFDDIKPSLFSNNNIIPTLYEFIKQLEKKLIYLEKEINVTKLTSFYTARNIYLQKMNVSYDDSKINELHNIINWLVIHKSTQLKGIASDKYLSCKYVKMKLGKDLCEHRIAVYENINDINFSQLIETGNYVLKITNGCHDNVFIGKNNSDIKSIKKQLEYSFNRYYGLLIPEFFHLYSKKRIILERLFEPKSDLYEFKILIVNNQIKMIYVISFSDSKKKYVFYDSEFNLINKNKSSNIDNFDKSILNELKVYAIKLSEDFPNFVRVDLYIFRKKIYFSELTFDSNEGLPVFRKYKIINETGLNWKRID